MVVRYITIIFELLLEMLNKLKNEAHNIGQFPHALVERRGSPSIPLVSASNTQESARVIALDSKKTIK